MTRLADEGATPTVVGDQLGRLELRRRGRARHPASRRQRRGVRHLPRDERRATDLVGRHRPRGVPSPRTAARTTSRRSRVRSTPPVSTAAPRPASSVLSLRKLGATGFEPVDAMEALRDYVAARAAVASVVVVDPDDVVLAGVVAALHLDHDQVLGVAIGDAVRRTDRRRRRSRPSSPRTSRRRACRWPCPGRSPSARPVGRGSGRTGAARGAPRSASPCTRAPLRARTRRPTAAARSPCSKALTATPDAFRKTSTRR